ncbi:SAM-dependent methyltransferase [Streptomyces sp. NPDC050355]|uniref:SAM-dependent methyltransferase n=1 Tax=Streptomyces sp. NPDC050355 TaxID=3365609 RepID=UPI0037B3D59A
MTKAHAPDRERAHMGAGDAFDDGDVHAYYTGKTADIVRKYGPGPRIHFHLGLFDLHQQPRNYASPTPVRRRLVDSQEEMLRHIARRWGVGQTPPTRLLDVGCGLGGGALYWAQEHDIRVTAVTNIAEHVPVIRNLARHVGVSDMVTTLHTDIHVLDTPPLHDAAVALESSGYMDRDRLFRAVAASLRPEGWFGIEEHFLVDASWGPFIDDYYKTHLGTVSEYTRAAEAAGFVLEHDEDLTDRVAEFWVQSMAWSTMELDDPGPHTPRERLTSSALAHGKFFRAWRAHAVETRLLLFRLRTRRTRG